MISFVCANFIHGNLKKSYFFHDLFFTNNVWYHSQCLKIINTVSNIEVVFRKIACHCRTWISSKLQAQPVHTLSMFYNINTTLWVSADCNYITVSMCERVNRGASSTYLLYLRILILNIKFWISVLQLINTYTSIVRYVLRFLKFYCFKVFTLRFSHLWLLGHGSRFAIAKGQRQAFFLSKFGITLAVFRIMQFLLQT